MVAELYPEAWKHLMMARRTKSDMASLWSDILEAGFADTRLITNPDGSGQIVAIGDWPPSARDRLTEKFRSCVNELWATLDSLVVESVAMFSVLKRPHDPEAPRYFPIADSLVNFEALLAESCLDGVLALQAEMVRDCQPFQPTSSDESIERFRIGLRQLLDWTNRLDDGSRVGAWITPIEPQLLVDGPVQVQHIAVQPAGELAGERVVATYRLGNYRSRAPVCGQAGSNIDLAFPDGFTPEGIDDRFDRRVNLVIDIVTRFAVSFWWLASKAPGAKRVIQDADISRAESWINTSRSPRRWSHEALKSLAASDFGVGVVAETDQLILIVATPNGVYERIIPNATPLRPYAKRGTAAELAIQDAAATWGLPDFVMRPHVEQKGSGTREISDGLIVVGDRGAIIQVKCREADPGDTQHEEGWIAKQIKKATSQISGTARRLSSSAVNMMNGRGRKVLLDGRRIEWVGVVIIDHPDPPTAYQVPQMTVRVPWIGLLRRDWEFLFNQLRSSCAVVDYLHRAGKSTAVLGGEPMRYYELAAADAAAIPEPIDPLLTRLGEVRSVPLLPPAPAGSDDNEAHGIVRIMCEDIATTVNTEYPEEDRIRLIAHIDTLPVGHRTELGRLLLDGLQAARRTTPGTTSWQFRTFRAHKGQVQLGFGVCSSYSDVIHAAFQSWILLRHHERGEVESLTEATSIGVLLTPRNDGYREWDTTIIAVKGDPELTEEELSQSRELWNQDR